MKKLIFPCFISCTLLVACTKSQNTTDKACGNYKGYQLYKGAQGGCYYVNSSGNKTYVDGTYCTCQ